MQADILPVHAQQHMRPRFRHGVDASGMRQASVSADNVARLRPVPIPSLTPLVVGNFHAAQTTLGRIIDGMQTPVRSFTARNAQHCRVIDPKRGPRGRFCAQPLRQQMRQNPLQQRRSLAQTMED